MRPLSTHPRHMLPRGKYSCTQFLRPTLIRMLMPSEKAFVLVQDMSSDQSLASACDRPSQGNSVNVADQSGRTGDTRRMLIYRFGVGCRKSKPKRGSAIQRRLDGDCMKRQFVY